ncbi:transporter substrate-binding domain-containing protein [Staphylococcus sp. 17KM0847]|uniref:transporter substrate-binding domain-containing protein n=1 Tax=Staphylococcus sp. 17KM0847 TaxID=2583989 RepID=UPI0015DD1C30|nr:transporter substrate-binding domain-containing protein [Staphylococcus sp. 17KM0847]QLK86996.1 transporter substrate-binding domain-containing protein [Staphylococcus sp. 17KM0847]
MKRSLQVVLLLGIVLLLASCQHHTSSNSSNKKVVKVALSAEINPPYLYTDENNEFVGLDMDYMRLLEKKLPQYDFQYEIGEEEANLVGIGAGKFDMGINWFFKTPEREKKFLYQDEPYSYSLTMLAVHKDNNTIHGLDDMTTRRLTPMAPSGGLYSILSRYNDTHDQKIPIDTIHSPSNGDNLEMIDQKRRDAMFINWNTYTAIQKELNQEVKIGSIVSKEPLHIVYNKHNQQLHDDIDRATKVLKEEGQLQKLSRKYFDIDIYQDLDTINDNKNALEVQKNAN